MGDAQSFNPQTTQETLPVPVLFPCSVSTQKNQTKKHDNIMVKHVDLSKQTSKQSSNSFQCKVDQECRIVSHRVATLHKLHHLIGRPLELLLACTVTCACSLHGLETQDWALLRITFVKITHCYALKYCMHWKVIRSSNFIVLAASSLQASSLASLLCTCFWSDPKTLTECYWSNRISGIHR